MRKLLLILSAVLMAGCSATATIKKPAPGVDYLANTRNKSAIPYSLKIQPNSKHIIVFLHGMGGSRNSFRPEKAELDALGESWFSFDQRGQGASTLPFSFTGSLDDLDYCISWLKDKYPDKKIIVIGHSLGASLACMLGTKEAIHKTDLVISISSPTKVGDMFAMQPALELMSNLLEMGETRLLDILLAHPRKFGNVLFDAKSLKEFIKDGSSMRMADHVKLISPVPLVFIHGSRDYIVPLPKALQLYLVAKQPKKLIVVKGEGHKFENEDYLFSVIKKMIETYTNK